MLKNKLKNLSHLVMKLLFYYPRSFPSTAERIDHVPKYMAPVHRVLICVVYFIILAFGIVPPSFLEFLYRGILKNSTESIPKLI